LGGDFVKLMDELTIARSRKHIQRYYKAELETIGAFPERKAPENHYISLEGAGLAYDRLHDEIMQYKLAIFYPADYVNPGLEGKYGIDREITKGFDQKTRERALIEMMKVNFLKRLESSVDSFRKTLERTIKRMQATLVQI